MHRDLLFNSFVLDRGAISKYGTFRILGKSALSQATGGPYEGLMVYHDELLGFKSPQYHLRIDAGETSVSIVDNKGNVVKTLTCYELHPVRNVGSYQHEVMAGGWLVESFRSLQRFIIHGVMDRRKMILARSIAKILRKAAATGLVGRWDNSPFFQVDPKLRGRLVMLFRLDDGVPSNANVRVIDSTGCRVEVKVKYPLARDTTPRSSARLIGF